MERVAAPLRSMGATVRTTDGHPPLVVTGGPLLGIEHFLGPGLGDALLAWRFPPDHPGVK